MNPLLKYFIESSIGYKEFSVIDYHIVDLLKKEPEFSEYFYLEPISDQNGVWKLWKLESWKQIQEGRAMIEKAQQEQEKEYTEKYNGALKYLARNMSEQEAKEMLEIPQIKAKFGL